MLLDELLSELELTLDDELELEDTDETLDPELRD
jgi:hypothetical protein